MTSERRKMNMETRDIKRVITAIGKESRQSTDRQWARFQQAIKDNEDKARDAEVRASQWLADGNSASEAGNVEKAEKCYATAQFWTDRFNKLSGRGA